ncbi:MAG: hypothetical protein ABFD07_16560 [Methanobacterium sp.]
MTIVPPSYYSLDPTTRRITFTAPYNTLTSELIRTIWNLSKQCKIYDSADPRNYTLFIDETDRTQDFDISITGGVLTYVTGTGMANTDKLQIEISDKFFANTPLLTTSIVFAAGDVLTTEKLTNALTIPYFPPSGNSQIAISKPNEATAGDLTVNIYNQIKIDGSTAVDSFLTSFTVEQISGLTTNKSYIVTGLGAGEGTIKLGMKFAADSGAITVNAAIYVV